MIIGGIFGPKLSGKTTLAKEFCRVSFERGQKALVFDPHLENWPKGASITDSEEKFWPAVWNTRNCLIVVEEAAATISRNRDLVPIFTRIRHRGHRLLVIGHSGMDLLPVMRQQFDTIYLFRQPESAAKVWAEVLSENALLQSTRLNRFEFLTYQMYGTAKKCRLKLS